MSEAATKFVVPTEVRDAAGHVWTAPRVRPKFVREAAELGVHFARLVQTADGVLSRFDGDNRTMASVLYVMFEPQVLAAGLSPAAFVRLALGSKTTVVRETQNGEPPRLWDALVAMMLHAVALHWPRSPFGRVALAKPDLFRPYFHG